MILTHTHTFVYNCFQTLFRLLDYKKMLKEQGLVILIFKGTVSHRNA